MQKRLPLHQKYLISLPRHFYLSLSDGYCGRSSDSYPKYIPRNELKARPIMVGFFFTGSAIMEFWSVNFWQGTPINKATVNYDSAMLLIWSAGLHAFCVESHYFILLSTGVLLSSFASTANRKCSPSPVNTPTEQAVRRSCQYIFTCSDLACLGYRATARYELAMGFSFKVMYLTAAIAFLFAD